MSLDNLSKETLENILIAYGFDDAARFSKEELITLAREMGVELPEQESHPENDQTAASIATSDSILVDLPATPADAPPAFTESILHAPSRPAKAADIAGTEERPIDLTSSEPIFSPASDPSASTGLSATGPPSTLTDEQELQLATFCDIASSDKDFARSILDSLGWDLDSAIAIYLEGGIQVPPKPVEPQPFVAPTSFRPGGGFLGREDNNGDESGPHVVHPPDLSDFISHLRQRHARFHDEGDGDEDDDDEGHISYGGFGPPRQAGEANSNQPQFYDDGVRVRTDPVRMQRLISRQQSDEQEHIMLGRADDPDVEWLVEPPRHLSYMGSLEHAKAKANEEGRWLFVNIQSHEVWFSNELNRTFADETIECIFRGQYLFWQRGHTSHDGREFMRLYKIDPNDLPIMFIIEPNTGARLKTFKGYMEPADLASALIEFHEKHADSLQNLVRSPKGNASAALSANDKDDGSVEVRVPEKTDTTTFGKPLAAPEVAVAAPAPAATPAPVPVAAPPAFDPSVFGEVPSLPGDKDAGVVRVAVKLPTKRITRRFRSTDTVRALFAFVASEDEESRQRAFDLVNPGPPSETLTLSLDDRIDRLNGFCVNHKWA